jgi:hypothetical protein
MSSTRNCEAQVCANALGLRRACSGNHRRYRVVARSCAIVGNIESKLTSNAAELLSVGVLVLHRCAGVDSRFC